MPLFDEDVEDSSGIPPETMALADAIGWADAVVISTPEYNKAVPGGLKNALDWLSRSERSPLEDKPLAIISAADGRAGGDRSQFSLRLCLTPFRPRVLQGPEVMVANSRKAFDDNGRLLEPRYFRTLEVLMKKLRAEVGR